LRIWLGGIAVGAVCLGSAWFGSTLLDRTPNFDPGLGTVAIVMAGVALLALVATSLPAIADRVAVKRIAVAAAGLGICATLLAPAAYSLDTTGIAYGGGDPHPGPGSTSGFGGGQGGLGGQAAFGDGRVLVFPNIPGVVPNVGNGVIGGGGNVGGTSTSALDDYLVANRGSATWIVAMNSAQEAGTLELTTGLPVMAMGGFTGSDPTPTLDQFMGYIASGKLRFVLIGGGGGGGGFGGGSSDTGVSSWVTSTCKVANVSGSSGLYDCAGAA
jgi:4-amino-4-deoxy-L-arabinose transferase-like glycosyltransferase